MKKKKSNFMQYILIVTFLLLGLNILEAQDYSIDYTTGNPIPSYVTQNSYSMDNEPLYNINEGLGVWSGYGPWGGNVNSFSNDPFNDTNEFVACGFSWEPYAGGVWKSENGGNTWRPTGLTNKHVNSIKPSYNSSGTFWAGAIDGLYKSTDYGDSWERVYNYGVSCVGVKRNDDDIIIIGIPYNNGIRRSTDGGLNWQPVGLNSGYLKEVTTTLADTEKIFIACIGMESSSYVSEDSGETWVPIGPEGNGWGIYVSSSNSDLIYLSHGNGIFKTENGGISWTHVLATSNIMGIAEHEGILYAAGLDHGVYESNDGETWNLNTNGIVEDFLKAIGSNEAGVLVGEWGCIYRTEEYNSVYELSHKGLNNTYVHSIVYYTNRDELWVGTEGSGLYCSYDRGNSWEYKQTGLNSWTIYDIEPSSDELLQSNRMMIATSKGVFASDSNGDSWFPISFTTQVCSSVKIHPNDNNKFWIGMSEYGVWYTEDGGNTWIATVGLPDDAEFPDIEIGVNVIGNPRIFVTFQHDCNTLYYSDDGVNFMPSSGLENAGSLNAISIRLPSNDLPQIIYCATDEGVYKSIDYAENWVPTSLDILSWSVLGTKENYVYAGTNFNGVYYSDDEGENWICINDANITNATIWSIAHGLGNEKIYAGLRGRGVRKYSDFVSSENKIIEPGWNWESFPRLMRIGNDPVEAVSVLENIDPFPTEIQFLGEDGYLEYSLEYSWTHHGLYDIISTYGYKLWTDNVEDSNLPVLGSRLEPDTPMDFYAGQENWIGYFLPNSQTPSFAFGDAWEHLNCIQAEDWSMYKKNGIWYGPAGVTLDYGKGYIVWIDQDCYDFVWFSFSQADPFEKIDTEYFTYEEKANYEAIEIDSISNGENIIEIGAFIDNVCVGASKVTEFPTQILAYTEAVNIDANELNFQVVSGRGNMQEVNSYSVYDFVTGKYEEKKLEAGSQKFSIVRLNTCDGITIPTKVSLSQNIPNPFGSNTTIFYALPEEAFVEISIYNIRGQKVKSIEKATSSAGNHNIIWDGKDDIGNRLENGIYFYKLSTSRKEIIKKMVLMR